MTKEYIIRDQYDPIYGYQYGAVQGGTVQLVARIAHATAFGTREEAEGWRNKMAEPHKYEVVLCGS